jgi:hypothetical protein
VRLSFPRAAALLAAAVVLSPLLRSPTDDTYPLSTYPMFASDRGAVHQMATAVEIEADGSASRLSPDLIAGTDEVVLASVTVTRAIQRGESAELCEEIAERAGASRIIEVRTELIDVVALVADDAPPISFVVQARCGGDSGGG